MTLQEAIDERLLSPLDLSTVFAVVYVANSLTPGADVVRGIAVENIGTEEVRSSYFSDINQNVKEWENLCDFHIKENMAASTALRQFIADWPEHVTLIGTNAETWLKPLCRSLDEEFELFKGRTYEVVDLGKFCTVTKEFQLNSNSRKLSVVLPTSRFNNKTGSLANLCAASGVYKNSFHNSIYAETRCQMLAEAVRRNLERELFSE